MNYILIRKYKRCTKTSTKFKLKNVKNLEVHLLFIVLIFTAQISKLIELIGFFLYILVLLLILQQPFLYLSCDLQIFFVHVYIHSSFNDSWIFLRLLPNESVSLSYTKYCRCHNTTSEDFTLNSYSLSVCFSLLFVVIKLFESINYVNKTINMKTKI